MRVFLFSRVLFPSSDDRDRGRESLLDFVVLSLGAPSVSSWSFSISLACSLDIIACGFPRAVNVIYQMKKAEKLVIIFPTHTHLRHEADH